MIKSLLSGSTVLALVLCGSAVAFAEEAAAPVATPEASAPAAAEVAAPAAQEVATPAATAEVVAPAVEPEVDIWKDIPDVVAEVDGVKITKSSVQEKFAQMLPGGKIPAGIPKEQIDQAVASLARVEVVQTLVANAIAKADFKPTDEEIKAFIKGEIAKWPAQMVQQYLESEKKTVDGLVEEMFANPEVKKSAVENMFMEKTLKSTSVTEEDAKKYYDENPDQFVSAGDPEDSFRASHILIGVKAQATDAEKAAAEKKINDILAKVKADPAKFEEIAKKSSDCPSAAQGGVLGNFRKGMMVPEFEEALEKLQEGEISGVVKTQFGYHIIRRDPLEKSSKIEFDQVKAQLIEMLNRKSQLEAMRNYVESLEKAAKIEYFIPVKAEN